MFTASTLLAFFATNIFEILPCTVEGKQQVIITTDRYSWLTRSMPTGKTLVSHEANVLSNSALALQHPCLRPNGQ